jgi:arylsulfatase A-like enzyme
MACGDLEEADNIYASVLSHADDRIGEVLDTLDQLGLTKNTLVIFSSDNGPARAATPTGLTLMHDTATGAGYGIGASKGITGGRRGYKAALFEGGIGVPFIARWPGKIAPGKVDNTSLISAVDLLPTFCEVAGVDLPSTYTPDGVSLVGTLLGRGQTKREKPLFWKMDAPWPAPRNRPDHWVSYGIVDQTLKLVANEDSSYVELYDIAVDPYEKSNLAKERPEVVRQLKKKLAVWKATLPAKPDAKLFSAERSNRN